MSGGLTRERAVGIRATNPYGFRSGEWATVTGLEWANDRPCYRIRFPDGATDSWVVSDPSDPYEFRRESASQGTCWFCKSEFVVDALIAGYDTFEEQRLACLACHERMSGNWRPLAALPSPETTPAGVLGMTPEEPRRMSDAEPMRELREALTVGLISQKNALGLTWTEAQAVAADIAPRLLAALSAPETTPAGVLDEAWAAAEKALPDDAHLMGVERTFAWDDADERPVPSHWLARAQLRKCGHLRVHGYRPHSRCRSPRSSRRPRAVREWWGPGMSRPRTMRTTEPDPVRVKKLAGVLHDQGIGCNYRQVPTRRYHNEFGDPSGFTTLQIYDDPSPVPPDLDGWQHHGDHELVARTMLDCGLVRDA